MTDLQRCLVPGCEATASVSPKSGQPDKRGLCGKHYMSVYRYAVKVASNHGLAPNSNILDHVLGNAIDGRAYHTGLNTIVDVIIKQGAEPTPVTPAPEPQPMPAPTPAPEPTVPVTRTPGAPMVPVGVASAGADLIAQGVATLLSAGQQSAEQAAQIASLQQQIEGLTAAIDLLGSAPVTRIEYTRADPPEPRGNVSGEHYMFPTLLSLLAAEPRFPIALLGPAGTGKTTAVSRAAKSLGLPFAITGALLTRWDVEGMQDAQGEYHPSSFYEAFTNGNSVFLFDDFDASSAPAMASLNSIIGGAEGSFCGRMTSPSPGLRMVASCNTWGGSQAHQFTGRERQDAATLDRFVCVTWPPDWRTLGASVGVSLKTKTKPPKLGVTYHDEARDGLCDRIIRLSTCTHREVSVGPRALLQAMWLMDTVAPDLETIEAWTCRKGADADAYAEALAEIGLEPIDKEGWAR